MKKKLLIILITAGICTVLIKTSVSYLSQDNSKISNKNKTNSYTDSTLNSSSENLSYIFNTQSQDQNIDIESFKDPNDSSIDILVRDDTFITQLDYIITNIDDFIGKRIKVEGILTTIKDNSFIVVRLYDMAHEDHSHEITVGINAKYDGEIPPEATWVSITGIIEKSEIDSRILPLVEVEKIEAYNTYGQEKVYN